MAIVINAPSPRKFAPIKEVRLDGTIPNQKHVNYWAENKAYLFSSGYGSDKIGLSWDGVSWEYFSKGENSNQFYDGRMAFLYGYLCFDLISGTSTDGQTVSPTDKILYATGITDTLFEQITLPVTGLWADIAAWPWGTIITAEERPCVIVVGGRHILVGDERITFEDTEITTAMVANTNSEAVGVSALSNGKFIIIMSEQQGRTNIIPAIYGSPESGWAYQEVELDEFDALSEPIGKNNCNIKNNGYMLAPDGSGIYGFGVSRNGTLRYQKYWYKAESYTYPVTVKALGDNSIAYGVFEKPVDGVMTQFGCVLDLYEIDYGKASKAITQGVVDGISVAISNNNVVIGTNNGSHLYYANCYDPNDMVQHTPSFVSDISNEYREDWLSFIEDMKAGKFQEAVDNVAWLNEERLVSSKFNEFLNFIEYVQIMKDDYFKLLTYPRIMTLGASNPQFDVSEGQMYFYLYDVEEQE